MTENLSQTYKEVAQEFINDNIVDEENKDNALNEDEKAGVILFAEFLDGKNIMGNEFTILAMQQARKIDREFILALIDVVGIEKSKEIALEINKRHKFTPCQDEAQNLKENKSSEGE